jgi:hypothetical protein
MMTPIGMIFLILGVLMGFGVSWELGGIVVSLGAGIIIGSVEVARDEDLRNRNK